jgi:hypothetical protein
MTTHVDDSSLQERSQQGLHPHRPETSSGIAAGEWQPKLTGLHSTPSRRLSSTGNGGPLRYQIELASRLESLLHKAENHWLCIDSVTAATNKFEALASLSAGMTAIMGIAWGLASCRKCSLHRVLVEFGTASQLTSIPAMPPAGFVASGCSSALVAG